MLDVRSPQPKSPVYAHESLRYRCGNDLLPHGPGNDQRVGDGGRPERPARRQTTFILPVQFGPKRGTRSGRGAFRCVSTCARPCSAHGRDSGLVGHPLPRSFALADANAHVVCLPAGQRSSSRASDCGTRNRRRHRSICQHRGAPGWPDRQMGEEQRAWIRWELRGVVQLGATAVRTTLRATVGTRPFRPWPERTPGHQSQLKSGPRRPYDFFAHATSSRQP
jgi:hypothetical protein